MHLGWDKFSCMIYAANHSKHLPSVIMIGGNVSTLTASILFRALQSHSFEFCGYSDFFFISGGENKSPSPIAAMDCRLSGNVQSLQLQVFFFHPHCIYHTSVKFYGGKNQETLLFIWYAWRIELHYGMDELDWTVLRAVVRLIEVFRFIRPYWFKARIDDYCVSSWSGRVELRSTLLQSMQHVIIT